MYAKLGLLVSLLAGQLILHIHLGSLQRLLLRHTKSLKVAGGVLYRHLLAVGQVLQIHLLNLPRPEFLRTHLSLLVSLLAGQLILHI